VSSLHRRQRNSTASSYCPSLMQACTSTNYINSTDPRHVVRSGVNRGHDMPLTGNLEREERFFMVEQHGIRGRSLLSPTYMASIDWLIEHGLRSAPTQYRLYSACTKHSIIPSVHLSITGSQANPVTLPWTRNTLPDFTVTITSLNHFRHKLTATVSVWTFLSVISVSVITAISYLLRRCYNSLLDWLL